MNDKISLDPVYRKVIADLRSCEERYAGLLKSIAPVEDDPRLLAALATLKNEVRLRRRLEAELLTAIETERQRIGQDLHDHLCQQLGATALIAASVARRIGDTNKGLGLELAQVPRLINATIGSCRDLARGLHPVTLATNGLPAALEELAARIPLGVKFSWPTGARVQMPPSTALHLYRIVEEAVGNAIKHADAATIEIKLEMRSARPVLIIEDDGKGFKENVRTNGMGMRNMHYRASVIGAKLTVEARKSRGTRVSCTLAARRSPGRDTSGD